jgi:hypothetical protein
MLRNAAGTGHSGKCSGDACPFLSSHAGSRGVGPNPGRRLRGGGSCAVAGMCNAITMPYYTCTHAHAHTRNSCPGLPPARPYRPPRGHAGLPRGQPPVRGAHPGAPQHPRCTCPNPPYPQHAHVLASNGRRLVFYFWHLFYFWLSFICGAFFFGVGPFQVSISGQGRKGSHRNGLAPSHWHRWDAKSQYDTCHIFGPQKH